MLLSSWSGRLCCKMNTSHFFLCNRDALRKVNVTDKWRFKILSSKDTNQLKLIVQNKPKCKLKCQECAVKGKSKTCLQRLHVKKVRDFGLTIPFLLQRRCKNMEEFMCILSKGKPTQIENLAKLRNCFFKHLNKTLHLYPKNTSRAQSATDEPALQMS